MIRRKSRKIEKLDHVYKVTYGKEEVSRLFKIVGVSRNIGIALIIYFCSRRCS